MSQNTRLSFASDDIERSTDPLNLIAVLKNTQPSPPETKEKESPPDLKERESIPALQCSAVLKKIQLSPPEITNKTYSASYLEDVLLGLISV